VLKLTAAELRNLPADTLAVPVCEDAPIYKRGPVATLIRRAVRYEEFSGKSGDRIALYDPPRSGVGRILFFGLGPAAELTPESFRRMAGRAVKAAIDRKRKALCIAFPAAQKTGISPEMLATALMEGACLANHVYDRFRSDSKKSPLDAVYLRVSKTEAKRFSSLAKTVQTVCEATCLAREWVSDPSNEKTPRTLAAAVRKKAESEGLKVQVMGEQALKKKKMGALLAVAVGSENRPAFVIVDYKPTKPRKTIALVGKGVTFDSGGYNLKPSGSLDGMKADMAGAAAVAATMIAVARLKPKHRVVAALPMVENMVSGGAIRPGDIIRAYSGKTVEIGNTDAEGRLILADAMAYVAEAYRPDWIIDMATLTGACLVALGENIAGVFSPEERLAEAIIDAGNATHERCWRLPLPGDYREKLNSKFADIRNIGDSRWGGAIVAALFLSEFVGDTPWAHIDIAGPAYSKKADDYCGPGGTGFGVRLLWDLLGRL
jgi:leucyl aminopeptidase